MHLVIDGYGAPTELLTDTEFICSFLDDYPSSIGMTKIAPPQVHTYIGATPEDWGVSGFVLIAESHISIHTFPEHDYLNIDVFSCKEFDKEAAQIFLQNHFGIRKIRSWTLDRGLEHLDPLEAAEVLTTHRSLLPPSHRG